MDNRTNPMRDYRSGFIFWGLLSAGMLGLLPLVNWSFSKGTIPLADTQRLFSLDLAHGYINRFLYRRGISGNSTRVVVGRQGWLFLGNHYNRVLDKTQGIVSDETSPTNVGKSIRELKQRQDWLTAKGIMTIFVIAPNKHSMYSEFLPVVKSATTRKFTDEFVARAHVAELNLLDLRPSIRQAKTVSERLYFKTDSHWNHYGAYLGYRDSLATLNNIYGVQMKSVEPSARYGVTRGGGDLARLLKIDALLDKDIDRDVRLAYAGSEASLCIQKLEVIKLASRGGCEVTKNRDIEVGSHPVASFNQHALNRMNVLWLRDSFGNNNSKLYQQTFSKLWEVHYNHFAKMDWHTVVEKLHPDLVIYQVVERAIHESAFQSVRSAVR